MRFLAFGAMAVVWGLTWIAAKWALEVAPPVFVAGLRLAGACAGFLVCCVLARLPFAVPSVARLLIASLLLNTGCYSLLFWGVAHTPTGIAAIVNLSLVPVLSMLVGALYGEETISVRRLAAVALGALGLTLLFTARGQTGAADESRIGLGLAAIVIATLSYAWGAILSKPLVRTMPPAMVAFWQTSIGAVSLLAVSAAVEGFEPGYLRVLSHGRPLAGMAFLILGGSLIGFSVYLWLLREWGAFRAGLYAFVSPAIAVGAGVAFAEESFGVWEGVGMVLMLAATGLVVRPEKERVSAS